MMAPSRDSFRMPRRARRALTVAVLGVMLSQSAQPASAIVLWNAAKNYSASLAAAAVAGATTAVAAAKTVLAQRTNELKAARDALAAASSAAQTAAAAAAVVNAQAAIAAAEAALSSASAAADAAAAVAAGVAAGTLIGEGVDWLISRCWDPPCDLTSADVGYVPPTNAELDGLVEQVLANADVGALSRTKADFDRADNVTPGSGTAAWDFIREGTRVWVIGVRGAAAFSAGRDADVLRAADDLQAALAAYAAAIDAFARVTAATPIYTGDALTACQNAREQVQQLQTFVDDFADPDGFSVATEQVLKVLDDAQVSVGELTDPSGNPRTLDGEFGYFPALSSAQFSKFMEDAGTMGAAALPPGEVQTLDALMSVLRAGLAGKTSVGADIADYIAEGDTGNESSLFGTSGELSASQVLQTSVTNRWGRIDLTESPLVIQASARLDDDADGVLSDNDRCPGTPVGAVADTAGCAPSQLDDDSDGVPNGADACPGTPGNAMVDSRGCAVPQPDADADVDADGVPDADDACSGTRPAASADATGCPAAPPPANVSAAPLPRPRLCGAVGIAMFPWALAGLLTLRFMRRHRG